MKHWNIFMQHVCWVHWCSKKNLLPRKHYNHYSHYIYIYLGILIDKCYGHIFYETNVRCVDGASGPKTEQWCLLQTNGFLNSISARTKRIQWILFVFCLLLLMFPIFDWKSNGADVLSSGYKENHPISHRPKNPPAGGTAPRGGAKAPGRKAWQKTGPHWKMW